MATWRTLLMTLLGGGVLGLGLVLAAVPGLPGLPLVLVGLVVLRRHLPLADRLARRLEEASWWPGGRRRRPLSSAASRC